MDLTRVEKRRSELLGLLLFLVMVFMGIVTVISFLQGGSYLIPSLSALSLLACLYVISTERNLKGLQSELIKEIIEKDRQVKKLDKNLKQEHSQLRDEKNKADNLGSRLQEVTRLYRAISTVNSIMDPKTTLDTVLRAALELTDGSCGSVMLLDEKKEGLFIACSHGLTEKVVAHTRQRIGDGVSGWVAQNARGLLLTEDLKEDERFRNLVLRDEDIRSAMSVPLSIRGQVIGVINLSSPNTSQDPPRKFSDADLRLASIFAQHASIAIENLRLLMALQKNKTAHQTA